MVRVGAIPTQVYTSPGEANEARKHIQILWGWFTSAAENSTLWEPDFTDLDALDDRRTLQEALWFNLPVSSLRAYTAEIVRWSDWCSDKQVVWTRPTVTDAAKYVKESAVRGDTVAAATLAHMGWLQRELGLRLHADAAFVKKQSIPAIPHVPKQKQDPRVKVIIALEDLSQSANVFVAGIGGAGALLWCAAIRFAHLQRSAVKKITPWFIEGEAARGKPRKQGRRKPFPWTASRYGIAGHDYFKPLDRLHTLLRDVIADDPEYHQYLLPDYIPAGAPIDCVEAVRAEKMSGPRFIYYVKTLLQAPPYNITEADLRDIAGHAFRHGLVTLAQRLMLPPHVLINLGLWAGGDPLESGAAASRKLAMPMLYSSEKLATQATGRTELVRGLRRAVIDFVRSEHGHQGKKVTLGRYARDERFNPTLDDLAQYYPDQQQVQFETAAWIRAKLTDVGHPAGALEGALSRGDIIPLPVLDTQDNGDEDECDTQGATQESDSESGESGSESRMDPDTFCWACTQNLDGRLHLIDEAADPCLDGMATRCGRRLRLPISGQGAYEARESGRRFSPRCRARLSSPVRAALV